VYARYINNASWSKLPAVKREARRLALNKNMSDKKEKYVPCCDAFKKFARSFKWFNLGGRYLLMPCLEHSGANYRINYCPSCGAEIRAVQIPLSAFNKFTT